MNEQGLERISNWGMIPFGSSQLQVRHLLLWLGLALWFLATAALTETQAITAFSFNLSFLITLVIVASPTRSITLQKVATCFFGGGLALGIVLLLALTMMQTLKDNPLLRPLLLVALEDTARILPVLYMLWRGRGFSSWTLGATDLLLMGAASGAGFAFAEDAFAHALAPNFQTLSVLMPASELVNGQLSLGSSAWTALAAATIGLVFLLCGQARAWSIPLACSGFGIALLDHIGLAYAQQPEAVPWVLSTLQFVTAKGYLTLALFLFVLLASVVVDLYVQVSSLPQAPEFKSLKQKGQREELDKLWDSILDLRRLCYGYLRYKKRPDCKALSLAVSILAQRQINRFHAQDKTARDRVPEVASQLTQGEPLQSTGFKGEGLTGSDFADPFQRRFEGRAGAPGNEPLNERSKQLIFSPHLPSPHALIMDLPAEYEVLSQVSSGGMGVVFKVRHRQNEKDLAIKVMRPQHAANPVNLRRFEQEARTAATLDHPNIVVVYDFGVTNNSLAYLVMEWLSGKNLEQTLQGGKIGLERFLNIFLQSTDALAYSHKHGIVHRDIKPSNIICSTAEHTSDFVKIVDFGIAKVLTADDGENMSLTQTGDIIGSPKYMSPEQCLGQPLDYRSDIYSLGCVMYEMIVGKPAFQAENALQMFRKHTSEMPPRPTSITASLEIPELVEPLLFKALQKDPANRFQSMDEVLAALRAIKAALLAQKCR